MRSLWCIYMVNTVIVIVLYLLAGLNLFVALNINTICAGIAHCSKSQVINPVVERMDTT